MNCKSVFSLRHPLLLAVLGVLATSSVGAAPLGGQSFGIGADIVSRYVWRGADFGEAMSVQPSLSFAHGGFEVGAWASWSVSADGASANENDLYVSYSFGPVTIGVTDYYFPSPEPDWPDGDYGFLNRRAHTFEPYISYSGTIDLLAGLALSPDTEHEDEGRERSLYVEAGVPFELEGAEVRIHAGLVGGESEFYGTDGAALVNVGITVAKPIEITDSFSLPVNVGYVLNPDTERSFLVFGLSLSP